MAYRGQEARIPYGELGLLTDMAANSIPPNALINARNITLINGYVQKAPGSRILNPSAALPASVVGLYDWRPTSVIQRTIAACANGNLYYDDGYGSFNGLTTVASGLTNLTPNCQFVQGGGEDANNPKKLFFTSFGENQVQVLNGTSTSFADIASPATDWTSGSYPRCGTLHRNRLWMFAGQFAYASSASDHEDFAGGNADFYPIFPGEGGDIRGCFVYKGRLFAFKDEGFVYWLDDSNADSDLWVWYKLAQNFGLAAPNAVVEALDDMIAGNTTGTLTSYKATDALGDIESADIFRTAQVENYIRNSTSKVGLSVQHIKYYAEKKQLFMTYRTGYYNYNNMLIVLDLNVPNAGPRIMFWPKGSPQCLALRKDNNDILRPMYGDKDGYVHFMDYEDRKEGNSAYEGSFQTPHLDFGSDSNKNFDHLAVTYAPEGNWNLSCDYYIDGKFIETIQFPMGQYTDPQLDTLLLDTSRLAQRTTETYSRPLRGSGRTISFKFYNSGSNQSFRVSAITVGFRPSGKQAQRNT